MSFHYSSKRTNKEKLIPLHVNNCECGVAVGRRVTLEAISGSISGDTHYYTLRLLFAKKKTHKKNKQKKIKKKKNILNYVMT